jgi:hypothetical protein
MRPWHAKAAEKADAKFKEAEKKCEAQSTLVTFLATSNRQWGSSKEVGFQKDMAMARPRSCRGAVLISFQPLSGHLSENN